MREMPTVKAGEQARTHPARLNKWKVKGPTDVEIADYH
jgi:hypothetical protein